MCTTASGASRATARGALCATLLALALPSMTGCGSKKQGLQARSSLELVPCRIEPFPREMLCTEIQRPRDPKDPSAGTISIAVSVIESWGTRNATQAPLFMLAGGPGQSARDIFPKSISSQLKRWSEHRDIVLMDIRGTGDSEPLDCELNDTDAVGLSFQEGLDHAVKTVKQCLEKLETKLEPHHYFTPLLADDLDAVREGLGYPKISLLGGSYGTRLAMEYARRHDEHTDRVILDGVAPVQLALPWHYAFTFERAWNKIAEYCEQDSACHARFPEMRSSLRRLIQKAEQDQGKTISVQDPARDFRYEDKVRVENIRQAYFPSSYSPSMWTLLPLAIDKALQGDWGPTLALGSTGAFSGMHMLVTFAISCNEDRPAYPQPNATEEMKQTLLGDVQLRQHQAICPLFSTSHPHDKSYFEPIKSERPFLLLSGDADPVTPPEWAEKVAPNFPNSLSLTVPFTGHGTTQSRCVSGIVEDFLSSPTPLSVDTACIQDTPRPYFFTSLNGPSQDFKAAQTLLSPPTKESSNP